MLDPKFIRQNQDVIKKALSDRNCQFDLGNFLKIDQKRLDLLRQNEELLAAANKSDSAVKVCIKEKKDPKPKIAESKEIKVKIDAIKSDLAVLTDEWRKLCLQVPNLPHSSLPVGGASSNEIIKEVGELKKFNFKPCDHIALAEKLDIIDFKRGTKLSGSNFVLYKGAGAQLERALINFMLDLHTAEHGYTEVLPPKLVNRLSMQATGQLPNLEDDMYATGVDDLFLIPTGEVPITNIFRDEILEEDKFPICYVAHTPCFRREAGSYGKDTRGLMRLHEFDKVEMVKFVKPQDSYSELEKLLANACKVLDLLNLPYRILLLATADISFAAAKCYDIELYAPGVEKWLEVSSCSNFEDFQARRGNIRYRDKELGKPQFVHTLNGSGVALARLVVAILENYQTQDGSITIPEVLRKYLSGREKIEK
ncbi:MAG: serine--tRNA ligase [Candidatus Omnitrophica bacterium]|nr:serine--tRNA ligase [Candidatus Omnitrophota bacterium]